MTISLILTLLLVSLNSRKIGGRTLRETREGFGAWPRAHPHSGGALKKIYTLLMT